MALPRGPLPGRGVARQRARPLQAASACLLASLLLGFGAFDAFVNVASGLSKVLRSRSTPRRAAARGQVAEDVAVQPQERELPTSNVYNADDLWIGDPIRGKVVASNRDVGWNVDLGMDRQGYLHSSQARGHEVKVGSEIDGWVRNVNARQVEVTLKGDQMDLEFYRQYKMSKPDVEPEDVAALILGQELKAEVYELKETHAVLDLGVGIPGVLKLDESPEARGREMVDPRRLRQAGGREVADPLVEGDTVNVRIFKVLPDRILVTRRQGKLFQGKPMWAFQQGQKILGRVVRVHEVMMEVDVGAQVLGLLPLREASVPMFRCTQGQNRFGRGQEIDVWIHRRTNHSLELTQRPENIMVEPPMNPVVELGKEVRGIVMNVDQWGAQLDIGMEMAGTIHNSKVANETNLDVRNYLSVGQEVTAVVLQISHAFVALSLRRDLPVLFKRRPRAYKVGEQIDAKIKAVRKNMLYVEIGCMVDGIVPASQLPVDRRQELSEVYQQGDEIKLWVLEPARERVFLTTREISMGEDPQDPRPHRLP